MVDFDQITEHIYVGGKLLPGDWYVLAALGITVDINLQVEAQDRFTGSAPDVYLWVPTPDWYGPGLETLRIVVAFIDTLIQQDRRIYVHCNAGIGRSPTVAAAYLVSTGLSPEQAVEHVINQRPRAKLNETQVQQVHDFSRWLGQVRGW